jgi:hypothetical protein
MGEVNEEGIVQPRGDEVDVYKRIGFFSREGIEFDELLTGH